jgi:hypothetical protein
MTYHEFLEIMSPLDLEFEKKPDAYYKDLFQDCRKIKPNTLREVVKRAKNTGRFYPKREELWKLINEVNLEAKERWVPVYCEDCGSTGFIVRETIGGQGLAYRCHCENGQRLSPRIPDYRKDSLSSLVPPPEPVPNVPYNQIEGTEKVFPKGVNVLYQCERCGDLYSVLYNKKTEAQEIEATHNGSLHYCEKCYREEGAKRGLWRIL